jgi:hypothetical protein
MLALRLGALLQDLVFDVIAVGVLAIAAWSSRLQWRIILRCSGRNAKTYGT